MEPPKNPGEETWETYFSKVLRKNLTEYNFRDMDGDLFTTVAPTLREARRRRDQWLRENREDGDPDAYHRAKEDRLLRRNGF
jgi:hypothetical protein